MNTEVYSQNTPIALANVTKNGITYSYGETDESLALSLSYGEHLNAIINDIIFSNFPNVNNDEYVIDNNEFYFFIEKLKKSTKIELKLKERKKSSDEFNDLKIKIKNIFKSINEL